MKRVAAILTAVLLLLHSRTISVCADAFPTHNAATNTHWAFQPRTHPRPPPVTHTRWVRNPIDAFIAQEHESHRLTPQPEAPREALYRRLHFDLLGLPPSTEDLARLERDHSDPWYEHEVDRLLKDPRYGERWGRHWMDIWRYSDWWGLGDQLRNSQKHIWHWRDWIIESVNADTPYDEMIREMLAADELYPEDLQKLRATGFLARDYFLFNRHQWMEEVVEHVGKGFLGLTVNCAKCHDHKYDPILQSDFYRMRAIFEPYHVRLDAIPGEPDLTRDGIPRIYDGLLDTVTYKFIRGNENTPDKSAPMRPGVPNFLGLPMPDIQPVALPPSAWQPERRPWVAENYLTGARRNLEAADARVISAQTQLSGSAQSNELVRLEYEVAQSAAALAKSELESLKQRINAMRTTWMKSDPTPPSPDSERIESESVRLAVLSERQVTVAKATHTLTETQLKIFKAENDKKEALEKDLKAAREALTKASTAATAPITDKESYTRLPGAQWTPTRFLNSTADDPTVPFLPQSSGRRKALAEWITDARHPLTARVAANHIWARHMGVPLVATTFEFGRKGSPPTHPALLDWLASELVESGWSMKHLHRLILTSATYRMSSSALGAGNALAKDPDNRMWWRRSPIRLEAQSVRDALLAHAGELDGTMGGPPIPQNQQADSKRRSLYFFHSNNDHNLFLSLFDDASVKECYRRDQSIVPQQALALTNSRLVHDSALAIAKRLEATLDRRSQPTTDDAFIRQSFALLLGMKPNAAELTTSRDALKALRTSEKGATPSDITTAARSRFVWALINHNDFVTLR